MHHFDQYRPQLADLAPGTHVFKIYQSKAVFAGKGPISLVVKVGRLVAKRKPAANHWLVVAEWQDPESGKTLASANASLFRGAEQPPEGLAAFNCWTLFFQVLECGADQCAPDAICEITAAVYERLPKGEAIGLNVLCPTSILSRLVDGRRLVKVPNGEFQEALRDWGAHEVPNMPRSMDPIYTIPTTLLTLWLANPLAEVAAAA